jgi:hypothetical protein
MEALIELVAASFARHGIECPAGDSPLARPVQPKPVETQSAEVVHPADPANMLPEHNYRKRSLADHPEICP